MEKKKRNKIVSVELSDRDDDPNYNLILKEDLNSMNHGLNDNIDLIWENLNTRLHQKFGYAEEISKTASSSDLNWARITLPAYINWDQMKSMRSLLEFWVRKIMKRLKKSEASEVNEASDVEGDKANEIDEVDEVDENVEVKEAGKYLIFFKMFLTQIQH
jgi:hypothetical protein